MSKDSLQESDRDKRLRLIRSLELQIGVEQETLTLPQARGKPLEPSRVHPGTQKQQAVSRTRPAVWGGDGCSPESGQVPAWVRDSRAQQFLSQIAWMVEGKVQNPQMGRVVLQGRGQRDEALVCDQAARQPETRATG